MDLLTHSLGLRERLLTIHRYAAVKVAQLGSAASMTDQLQDDSTPQKAKRRCNAITWQAETVRDDLMDGAWAQRVCTAKCG